MNLTAYMMAFAAAVSATAAIAEPVARFAEDDALLRPEGYREWVFLGTTVQPKDINLSTAYAPGIKHTYMDPGSFAHWKKTGSFRTGTVIVQERVSEERSEFMNAEGYIAGKFLGLQVMVKSLKRFPDTVWGFYSFGRPPYADKVWPLRGLDELDCGGCHTRADQDWVFTRFYPVLLQAAPKKSEGQKLFERDWTPVSAAYQENAARDDMGDGLGPLFNATSCTACHEDGGRGTFSVRTDGLIEGHGLVLKIGQGSAPDPTYGRQIQTDAVSGHWAEGRPAVQYEMVRRADGTSLRRPGFHLRHPGYGRPDSKSRLAGRIAQSLRGLGALEKVSTAALESFADPKDKNGDGISGRLNRLGVKDGEAVIGRYGWKAAQPSLKTQTAQAFHTDMGLSTPVIPAVRQPWGDCTTAQSACQNAPTGEHPRNTGREINDATVTKITAYIASLEAPRTAAQGGKGKRLFVSAGCAACHVPSLPLSGGGKVAAYTDLLLHDMGEGLADGLEEGSASGVEWRTAPLMGLGRLIRDKAPLLHDGRALTVNEAILWHGGEGTKSAEAYSRLPAHDRAVLHMFLGAL